MSKKTKTTATIEERRRGRSVTRREFAKIAGVFGLTSALLSLAEMKSSGLFTSAEALAASASATHKKRYLMPPKVSLKLGTSQSEETLLKTRMGTLVFISDIESRTDGAVRVEFIGSNKFCNELTCVKKCQDGEIDLFTTTTQNAAHRTPYMNVLDFAYLWPGRAAQYYFFYHPKSEPLFYEIGRAHV